MKYKQLEKVIKEIKSVRLWQNEDYIELQDYKIELERKLKEVKEKIKIKEYNNN
jgi:hypothetical protein